MDGWINEMWSIHPSEYYSAFKRKEILTQATSWMNLEDIMLSDISQAKGQILYNCTHMRALEESNSQRQKVDGGGHGLGEGDGE